MRKGKKHFPHRVFWITTSIFLLCGLIFLIYWFFWGQFRETTNDTYVNGNMIFITPQEEGIVTTLWVDNTQIVQQGQPIAELDKHDYEISFDRAKADLAESVRQVSQMFIKVDELKAKCSVQEATLLRAELDITTERHW
jgi:membrane fusion protein (multidrug efflux system)